VINSVETLLMRQYRLLLFYESKKLYVLYTNHDWTCVLLKKNWLNSYRNLKF